MTFDSKENFRITDAIKNGGFPRTGATPLDRHYDKLFYGLVDQKQDAVLLKERSLDELQLPKVLTIKQVESEDPVFALNFVADAFEDLRRHVQRANSLRRLKKTGKEEIRKLEAKSGFSDLEKEYDDYIDFISGVFINTYLTTKHRKQIVDFGVFARLFKKFHDEFGNEIVITKPGFIKSPLCNPLHSGLMIEVADIDGTDEEAKEEWITDPNFDFFRNAAIKFGFMVDKYHPWRLIADVSSTQMQDYWVQALPGAPPENKYGLIPLPGKASNLFDAYYDKAHLTTAQELRDILYNMYNTFIKQYPQVVKVKNAPCNKGITKSFIDRKKISMDTLERDYDMDYWLDFCFAARLKEENLKISKAQYNMYLRNGRSMIKRVDISAGMNYINNMLKMLKSKQTNTRFCQNYDKCVD